MDGDTIRRSLRLNPYDSNGREYLAGLLGTGRVNLESWIVSPTVRPHLAYWYRICISGSERFNDAIKWINSGDAGYYYNPAGLEEDLLLICLGGGDDEAFKANSEPMTSSKSFAELNAKTKFWSTRELWARAAWRVVHDNRSEGQPFEKRFEEHPAACYGVAIDLLCLAFHSIAFRGKASAYEGLINGEGMQKKGQEGGVRVEESSLVDDNSFASATSDGTHGTTSMEIDEKSSNVSFSDGTEATSEANPSPKKEVGYGAGDVAMVAT
ncbi:hypothetical protein LTR09_001534 [Extremus antarcticus]|uniref:Uncharacterized protein n=1 Tax=Extremus antarcticus TaxID=702011 RepID=A0AAJ0GGY9_9PEZI|nr:hypothetical protein LTR09_001534 [Extremus antarcticus]